MKLPVAMLLLLLACETRQPREPADGGETDAEGDAAEPFTCIGSAGEDLITLSPEQLCDRTPDCRNSADEVDCPGVFVCPDLGAFGTGHVIDEALVCDGVAHCYRAEDESDCPDLELTLCESSDEGSFTVYRPDQRCDGHAECFRAVDEVDCPNSLICPTTHFGQQVAIPSSKVCDGVWDCSIDEFDCPDVVDPFTCENGKTIDRKFMCDKAEDCRAGGFKEDVSDETDPSCEQFACDHFHWEGGGRAPWPNEPWHIDADQVCDGIRDCSNGDDERDCPEPFACSGGLFVRAGAVCDGKPDCPEGEDEVSCP